MKWTRPIEVVLAVLLAVLSCLVLINVVLRYGFGTSVMATDELSRYLFVWMTFLGAILACVDDAHVDVRIVVDKLPVRMRELVNAIGLAAMVFCCGLLLVGSWVQTQLNWSNFEPISGIPQALMYVACIPTAIAIGVILSVRLVKCVRRLVSGAQS